MERSSRGRLRFQSQIVTPAGRTPVASAYTQVTPAARGARSSPSEEAPVLHEFIGLHREEIISRCRHKVASRSTPLPTRSEIDHGVPLFLDQLGDALRAGSSTSPVIGETASLHGRDLLLRGFTVTQVVHDYGDVCQSITELAIEMQVSMASEEFRLLNACLDDAIAGALTEFGRELDRASHRSGLARERERFGLFAHELRNLLHTSLLSYHVIKSGNVGVSGGTGAILGRNLQAACDLVDLSLAEISLTEGMASRETTLVVDLINELAPSATLTAGASRIALQFLPVGDDVAVHIDPIVIAAALLNLIQNAVKFTKPSTTVTLRVRLTPDRVMIDVEDECGGLPIGDSDDLFRPFQQSGADRSGVGLGLPFSRRAVEAHDGRLTARDLPGQGCIFTVDLPRTVTPVQPAFRPG